MRAVLDSYGLIRMTQAAEQYLVRGAGPTRRAR